MAKNRIQFGGQSIRIPGAYSQVDAKALTPTVLGAFSRIGVIGTATGGVPKVSKSYTSLVAAEADLVSGDLIDAMKLMWNPSSDQSGASEILACRVDNATQSTANLADTSSVNAILLTSKNYGSFTRNIKYTITDNSDGYGKKLEIWNANDQGSVPEQSFNGLGQVMQITRNNTGAVTNYVVAITNILDASYEVAQFEAIPLGPVYKIHLAAALGDISTKFLPGFMVTTTGSTMGNNGDFKVMSATFAGGQTVLTIQQAVINETPAPATAHAATFETHKMDIYENNDPFSGTPIFTFDFTNPIYSNVYKIVSYLNSNYSASYNLKIIGDNMISRYMDTKRLDSMYASQPTNTSVKPTANIQTIIDWITTNSNLISAARLVGATSLPLKNVMELALSGGSNGSTTSTDWEDAILKFEGEDVSLMVVLTDDLGIQLALKQHINYMSTQGRSERRGYYGHAIGDSIDDIKDRALALSSNRAMLLSPGVAYDVDENGDPILQPSYYAAAICCGMVAGFAPQTPLTNKQLGIIDIEKSYIDSEILELLDAGVAPIKYDRIRGLFKLVQGQTTWLADDNTLYKEDSVGRIADFISINVRRQLEDNFVGRAAESGVEEDIRIHVTDMLRQMLDAKLITNYAEVTVVIQDTIAYVSYQVAPSEPINFILITTRFVPSRLVA